MRFLFENSNGGQQIYIGRNVCAVYYECWTPRQQSKDYLVNRMWLHVPSVSKLLMTGIDVVAID